MCMLCMMLLRADLSSALNELAEASGVGFRVNWEKITLTMEVADFTELL